MATSMEKVMAWNLSYKYSARAHDKFHANILHEKCHAMEYVMGLSSLLSWQIPCHDICHRCHDKILLDKSALATEKIQNNPVGPLGL